MTDPVAAGVDAVRRRVADAAARVGRRPDEVTLVAVTKYLGDDVVEGLVAAGVGDLGENRYQQLRQRAPRWPTVRWHAIGPLQTNKAGIVARHATAFHALDRIEVAVALSARRQEAGLDAIPCFVQVNVAGEDTKSGVAPDGLGPLLDALAEADLAGVAVVGLMAMPPPVTDPGDSRRWFARTAELAAANGLAELSMGTSADFEVAVEEGATVVRVGGLLGPSGRP